MYSTLGSIAKTTMSLRKNYFQHINIHTIELDEILKKNRGMFTKAFHSKRTNML